MSMIRSAGALCSCFAGAHDVGRRQQSRRRFLRMSAGIALAGISSDSLAQNRWVLGLEGSCTFYPNDIIDTEIFTFDSFDNPEEAMGIVKKITSTAGLPPNFEVLEANVPNAAAVVRDGKRVILYSQVFIDRTSKRQTEWAAWTILAHEVGHHLSGHTLVGTGSRPSLELEADLFAGTAINRMRGSLEQALSAYTNMSEKGTKTHPPRSARLEAVTAGWRAAERARRDRDETAASRPQDATPATNPDEILRATIRALQSNSLPPFYMTPEMHLAISYQLPQIAPYVQQLGPVVNVQLLDRQQMFDSAIVYTYRTAFQRGVLIWTLGVAPNGTLTALTWNIGQ